MWRTIFLTAVLFGLYWLVAARGPRAVGLWQDDAIYLCTAKSLAAGSGYRHIEIPSQPLQTQYPILYPALLAVGFLIGGQYPANLVWLLVPSALAAALLVTLSIRYCRDVLAAEWGLLVPVAILAALSPALLSFARFTMSDLPYGALAIAALYAVDYKYTGAKGGSQQLRWLLIAAVLVALSALMRSIGITLAAGLLIVLWWRRQFRHAGLAALVLAIFLVPWWIRQALAARANGPLQHAFLIEPYLRYSLWFPHSIGDTARVAIQNFFRTALGLSYFQMALPQGWVQRTLTGTSWSVVLLHTVSYVAMLLILVGFVGSRWARDTRKTPLPLRGGGGLGLLHVYAVLYGVIVLAWPFEPYRFLLPWTPLLLYFLLAGVRRAARAVPRAGAFAMVPVGVVALALGVGFVADDARIATSTAGHFFLREFPIDWTEVRAVEQWVAHNTKPDDILAAPEAAELYLVTGRQGYYFWPDTDPYRLFYGPDRSWKTFCALPGASETQYMRDELRRLPEVYAAAGIGYYIEQAQIDVGDRAMARYVRAHPERFTPVFATSGGDFVVYRVRLPT